MAKDPALREHLATVMYCLLEAQRLVHFLVAPFMPDTARKALTCLGWQQEPSETGLVWGKLEAGTAISKAEALFPRIEIKE